MDTSLFHSSSHPSTRSSVKKISPGVTLIELLSVNYDALPWPQPYPINRFRNKIPDFSEHLFSHAINRGLQRLSLSGSDVSQCNRRESNQEEKALPLLSWLQDYVSIDMDVAKLIDQANILSGIFRHLSSLLEKKCQKP